jgi:transposase-like protein
VSETKDLSAPQKAEIVSTEVTIAPRSKRYSAAFKLRLIEEADRCQAPGELGALLRREGIFSSTLSDFRKQKARGDFDGKSIATAPKEVASPQVVKELAASQREVRRLKRELDCATALLELQKKVSEILGLAMTPAE